MTGLLSFYNGFILFMNVGGVKGPSCTYPNNFSACGAVIPWWAPPKLRHDHPIHGDVSDLPPLFLFSRRQKHCACGQVQPQPSFVYCGPVTPLRSLRSHSRRVETAQAPAKRTRSGSSECDDSKGDRDHHLRSVDIRAELGSVDQDTKPILPSSRAMYAGIPASSPSSVAPVDELFVPPPAPHWARQCRPSPPTSALRSIGGGPPGATLIELWLPNARSLRRRDAFAQLLPCQQCEGHYAYADS